MNKVKKIYTKTLNNPILFSACYILVLALINFNLNKMDIAFRQKPAIFLLILPIILTIYGIITLIKKEKMIRDLFRLLIGILAGIFAILCILGWRMILLLAGLTLERLFPKEHIIIKEDGTKLVAYVESVWMDTTVTYYKYYNPLFCSYTSINTEHFSGNFDPFDGEHENYNSNNNNTPSNIHNQEETNPKEDEKIIPEITEDNKILYKETFADTTIAAVCKGDWSGRHIVVILKSRDNGITWESMQDSPDDAMDLHYGTKFIFFNENLGFYYEPGFPGSSLEDANLMQTLDGGKTFTHLELQALCYVDEPHYIKDLPYIENGLYKLNVYSYKNNEEIIYTLYSKDGFTWELE